MIPLPLCQLLSSHQWFEHVLATLAGGFNHLKKYWSTGRIIPSIMENRKCSKAPISTCLLVDTHPFPFWLPLLKCVQNLWSTLQHPNGPKGPRGSCSTLFWSAKSKCWLKTAVNNALLQDQNRSKWFKTVQTGSECIKLVRSNWFNHSSKWIK